MIKELLEYVQKSKISPLITSSVFHHEFEFIHPFSDGNGRMGRLWQHVLLSHYHPLFEFAPLESVIRERQKQYYQALEKSDRATDSTAFVEFILKALLDCTSEFLLHMRTGNRATAADRLQWANSQFKSHWFSRKVYHQLFERLSLPTASRDLKQGVDLDLLQKSGDKALARYRFRK